MRRFFSLSVLALCIVFQAVAYSQKTGQEWTWHKTQGDELCRTSAGEATEACGFRSKEQDGHTETAILCEMKMTSNPG